MKYAKLPIVLMKTKFLLFTFFLLVVGVFLWVRQSVKSQVEYKYYLPVVMREGKWFLPLVMNEVYIEPAVPPYTTSYYMKTVDSTRLYNLGCEIGTRDSALPGVQDSVVVLDFGAPTYYLGAYGTRLFSGYGYVSVTQIRDAIKNYGQGYYVCSGIDDLSHLTIGIGTSNWELDNYSAANATYALAHGQAWAQMVNDVNAWFVAQGYSGQVAAWGANDIELSWNSYAVTKLWMDGYDTVNLYPMLDYGALEGCPTRLQTGWKCSGGPTGDWAPAGIPNQERAWYKAYGAPPNYPLPEVYIVYGTNARQWAYLSYYGYTAHGKPMEIKGSLTQWQACQQVTDPLYDCINETDPDLNTDNPPEQGWQQMQDEVNEWPGTSQIIPWSTDIKWLELR
jgi:hypothetical protein